MPKKALLGQLADVDVRLLRIFRSIADVGGISAAELELNIGRSTISRHLKDLESRLGMTLCRRGRAGFSLTDEGRDVYEATLRLLAALDDFRSSMDDVHKRMRGQVTIALHDKTVTNPDCHIHRAIREFSILAPEVAVEMYIEPLNDVEKGVMEGRFQIGVVPMHRQSSSFVYHPLFQEPMHLYCGPFHPLFSQADGKATDEEIRGQKYAGLGYHSPNMEIGNRLGMTRHATGYDQEAIAILILSGRYIGYLPDHYAQQFIEKESMRLIGVNTFHYTCEFSAILRQSPRASRVVATLLECLRQAHGPVPDQQGDEV
ncbi:MAG: LysR family transcriptional regulator [Pseudomonadales bacterium]